MGHSVEIGSIDAQLLAFRQRTRVKPLMKRKEAIIRYLAHVTWANRHQIAEAINATPEIVSARLTELRYSGIVRCVEWADGSMVWVLTKEGAERFDYYRKRDSQRE